MADIGIERRESPPNLSATSRLARTIVGKWLPAGESYCRRNRDEDLSADFVLMWKVQHPNFHHAVDANDYRDPSPLHRRKMPQSSDHDS